MTVTNTVESVFNSDEIPLGKHSSSDTNIPNIQIILDNLDYGIIILDQHLRISFINKVAKQVTLLEDEFVEQNPHVVEGFNVTRQKGGYNHIAEADWEQYIQAKIKEFKQPSTHSEDIELEDGRVYTYTSKLLAEGGRLLTYTDITKNKKTEKALQEERNLLQTMMDAIPEQVYFKDRHSKIIFANKHMYEYFGFSSKEEIIGKSDFDIHNSINAQEYFNSEQKLMKNQIPHFSQQQSGAVSGKDVWFYASKAPVYDSDGNVIGVAGISQDITQRKATELVLNRQNSYLSALNKTSLAIMEKVDFSKLTKTIVEQASILTNSDSFLFLPKENQRQLYCAACSNTYEKLNGIQTAIENGVVGKVWENKTTLFIKSYGQWSERLEDFAQVYSGSIIATPLFNDDVIIAVLAIVTHNKNQQFSNHDVEYLENFAKTASIALEGTQLYEKTAADLKRSQALFKVSQVLNKTTDTMTKLNKICTIIFNVVDACWAIIDDYNEESNLLSQVVSIDKPDFPIQPLPNKHFTDESLTMWAIRNKTTVLSSKHSADQRESQTLQNLRKEQGLGSIIIVPLIIDNEVNSSFAIMRRFYQPDFNQDDLNFVTTVVNQVAVARKQKQLVDTIDHQKMYDSLTGLPNRSSSINKLWQSIKYIEKQPISKQGKFAILCLDVDNFKLINDTLGYDIGDIFLSELSNRLNSILNADSMLTRMGSNNFTIFVSKIRDSHEANAFAKHYLKVFEEAFRLGDEEYTATCSIGISIYPDDGTNPITLLKHADTAMHGAKAKGKNAILHFTQHLANKSRERLVIESDLRLALTRKEFLLYYQPQIDLVSGAIIGVEALIRWQHPQRGLVSPGKFILVAEKTQMIIPMGEWALKEACRQHIRWQAEGHYITMSVNVAAVQFARADFVDTVLSVLENVGLEPNYLELEVTEGVVMDNIERVASHLERLRYFGISVALDDFGTGFSCLQYLQDLPFDKLKIDKSFIMKLGDASNGQDASTSAQLKKNTALVEHIVSLAKGLNLKIVAEGIETGAQAAYLKKLACEQGQGFYFSKPVPADMVFTQSLPVQNIQNTRSK